MSSKKQDDKIISEILPFHNYENMNFLDKSLPKNSALGIKIKSSSTTNLNSKSNKKMSQTNSENVTIRRQKVTPQSLSKKPPESKLPQIFKNASLENISNKRNTASDLLSDKRVSKNTSKKLTYNILPKKESKNNAGKTFIIYIVQAPYILNGALTPDITYICYFFHQTILIFYGS